MGCVPSRGQSPNGKRRAPYASPSGWDPPPPVGYSNYDPASGAPLPPPSLNGDRGSSLRTSFHAAGAGRQPQTLEEAKAYASDYAAWERMQREIEASGLGAGASSAGAEGSGDDVVMPLRSLPPSMLAGPPPSRGNSLRYSVNLEERGGGGGGGPSLRPSRLAGQTPSSSWGGGGGGRPGGGRPRKVVSLARNN